eukprot:COSAG06_NODE_3097_length_5863_cov_217.544761_1_plen_145_part_10
MATEPVRRKCASSPTPDGKEGWQGIALEREQIGETDEEFRADVEFMEARAEKVLEELRRLLGQFRHRSYSGLRGQEFLMICKDGRIPVAKIAKGTVHGCGQRRDTDVIVEIEWEGLTKVYMRMCFAFLKSGTFRARKALRECRLP